MTDVCRKCKFLEVCQDMEYDQECTDQDTCEHFDSFLEGYYNVLEAGWMVEGT